MTIAWRLTLCLLCSEHGAVKCSEHGRRRSGSSTSVLLVDSRGDGLLLGVHGVRGECVVVVQ
jgi:hypothetical protein